MQLPMPRSQKANGPLPRGPLRQQCRVVKRFGRMAQAPSSELCRALIDQMRHAVPPEPAVRHLMGGSQHLVSGQGLHASRRPRAAAPPAAPPAAPRHPPRRATRRAAPPAAPRHPPRRATRRAAAPRRATRRAAPRRRAAAAPPPRAAPRRRGAAPRQPRRSWSRSRSPGPGRVVSHRPRRQGRVIAGSFFLATAEVSTVASIVTLIRCLLDQELHPFFVTVPRPPAVSGAPLECPMRSPGYGAHAGP
jgi:hypothetical protein